MPAVASLTPRFLPYSRLSEVDTMRWLQSGCNGRVRSSVGIGAEQGGFSPRPGCETCFCVRHDKGPRQTARAGGASAGEQGSNPGPDASGPNLHGHLDRPSHEGGGRAQNGQRCPRNNSFFSICVALRPRSSHEIKVPCSCVQFHPNQRGHVCPTRLLLGRRLRRRRGDNSCRVRSL